MSGQLTAGVRATRDSNMGVTGQHLCEVQTTCQPPSSWCKDPWPATIRDISNSSLSLTLNRRFERGSGLAIELPAQWIFVHGPRPRHRRLRPSRRWQLGCSFVSELSDEEVRHILDLDPLHQAALAGKPGAAVSGVLFHARIRPGEYLRWYVKRLSLSSLWPLPSGMVFSFQVGSLPDSLPVEMKVKKCQLFGSYWIIDCKLLSIPADDVLRALSGPPGE